MSEQLFGLVVTAVAEVRDADGNLVSSTPVEGNTTVTAEQAQALINEGAAQWQ